MDETTDKEVSEQNIEETVKEAVSDQTVKEEIVAQEKKSDAKPTPPTTPPAKITKHITPIAIELQYRLNVFSHTGNVKPSISAPIYQDMCRRHGDIMRSISSTKWSTMDEILKTVWDLEKKMRHPSNRTRKAVETAVNDLIERQFVITR